MKMDSNDVDISIANWLGLENPSQNHDGVSVNRATLYDIIDEMLSLVDISNRRIDPECRETNIRHTLEQIVETYGIVVVAVQSIVPNYLDWFLKTIDSFKAP